jgi:hypothetical protein
MASAIEGGNQMGLHDTHYAEFRARLRGMTMDEIELYVANPKSASAWFPWYRFYPEQDEVKECIQMAQSEIGRRKVRHEDRRYWVTTLVAVAALLVSLYAALKP